MIFKGYWACVEFILFFVFFNMSSAKKKKSVYGLSLNSSLKHAYLIS